MQRHHDSELWWLDTVAGLVSGMGSTFFGHPFDTVKVRLQTAAPGVSYEGALDCSRRTVHAEGFSALFKGLLPPLATTSFQNAICFGAYASSGRWLENRLKGTGNTSDALLPRSRKYEKAFLAGCIAGFLQSFTLIPTENLKTKMQVQRGKATGGTLTCIRKVYASQGFRGFFGGTMVTIIRDTPSYGLYFVSYEAGKDALREGMGFGEQLSEFISGGTAGCLAWASIYPLDVIKSRQQARLDLSHPEVRSAVLCARTLYAEGGGMIFFRGLQTTMLRAFLVNAVIFPLYEGTKRLYVWVGVGNHS